MLGIKGIAYATVLSILIGAVCLPTVYGWGTRHGDNDPSSNMGKYCSDTLKACAKSIDDMEYKDRSMNWNAFKQTGAYLSADNDERKCLNFAHKDGHGANGLASYEVLTCYKNPESYE